jgi:hypothetical protein
VATSWWFRFLFFFVFPEKVGVHQDFLIHSWLVDVLTSTNHVFSIYSAPMILMGSQ